MSIEEFKKWLDGFIDGQTDRGIKELLIRVKNQVDKIQKTPLSILEHLNGIQYTFTER